VKHTDYYKNGALRHPVFWRVRNNIIAQTEKNDQQKTYFWKTNWQTHNKTLVLLIALKLIQ
jgi:hypothetical protein